MDATTLHEEKSKQQMKMDATTLHEQKSLPWKKMDTTTQYYRVHYNGRTWTQLPNITEFITMEENEHNYPILQSSLQWKKMNTTTQYYRVHYNGRK